MLELKNNRFILNVIILIFVITILREISYFSFSYAQTEETVVIEVKDYYTYVETVGSVSFFVTVGEVRNNFTTNLKSLKVNATYYYENDTIAGTNYNYPALDMLEPDSKSPFTIYWNIKPSQDVPATMKLTCTGIETNEEPTPMPQVENLTNYTDGDGYFVVQGKIRNIGRSKAYNIKIFCSYYDANEKLTKISSISIPSEIDVDHSATFQISSKPFEISPANYEVLAVVRYKPKMIVRVELLLILAGVFFVLIVYMKKYRGW